MNRNRIHDQRSARSHNDVSVSKCIRNFERLCCIQSADCVVGKTIGRFLVQGYSLVERLIIAILNMAALNMVIYICNQLLDRGLQPVWIMDLRNDLPRRRGKQWPIQSERDLSTQRVRQILTESNLQLRFALFNAGRSV